MARHALLFLLLAIFAAVAQARGAKSAWAA
jgi:hypothetical protein